MSGSKSLDSEIKQIGFVEFVTVIRAKKNTPLSPKRLLSINRPQFGS